MVKDVTDQEPKPGHFLREWRQHRKLSLRALSDKLEPSQDGERLTHASVSRIERGLQPYSQSTIEALAKALDVTPAELLAINPLDAEGAALIVDALRNLDDDRRDMLLRFAKSLSGASGET